MSDIRNETLCFSCANACNHGCSWSDEFIPVEGWTAVPNKDSFQVISCPEYKKDTYTDERGVDRTIREMHPGMDTDGYLNLLEGALRQLRNDYILGKGPYVPGKVKGMNRGPGENRKAIEREIRSEHFCAMFHIDNPDGIIQELRAQLQRYLKKTGQRSWFV